MTYFFTLHRAAFFWMGAFACLAVAPLSHAAEISPKLPKTENRTVITSDGVVVHFTYYPGGAVQNIKSKEVSTVPGKAVVPIIMVHGWGGQRSEFDYTAGLLQRLGHAVVVPDLRGHGESVTRRIAGQEIAIDRERLRAPEIDGMVRDIEAVRKFLLERNDAQELNIEMLGVVGAELGAMLAVNWSVMDWSRPQLPGFKQGCDVKALVLLAPQQSFKGVTMNKALQTPIIRSGLSIMIVAGKEDEKGYRIAKSIHERLEKARPQLPTDPKERQKRQDLFFLEPPTSLSGTKLLTPRGLTVNQDVAGFIHLRLTNRSGDFPWIERKHPLVSQ